MDYDLTYLRPNKSLEYEIAQVPCYFRTYLPVYRTVRLELPVKKNPRRRLGKTPNPRRRPTHVEVHVKILDSVQELNSTVFSSGLTISSFQFLPFRSCLLSRFIPYTYYRCYILNINKLKYNGQQQMKRTLCPILNQFFFEKP